jgi:putative effector of murein hydrolase LrgA (UPF0299 family)
LYNFFNSLIFNFVPAHIGVEHEAHVVAAVVVVVVAAAVAGSGSADGVVAEVVEVPVLNE